MGRLVVDVFNINTSLGWKLTNSECCILMRNMSFKSNIRRRFFAALIDYTIVWTLTFLYIRFVGTETSPGSYHIYGTPALVPWIIWFLILIGTEAFLGGTIGNSAMRLKVLSIKDVHGEIKFWQSLVRRLFDPIDMYLFGIVAIISIFNTKYRQRLGDLTAGTIVVQMKDIAFLRG